MGDSFWRCSVHSSVRSLPELFLSSLDFTSGRAAGVRVLELFAKNVLLELAEFRTLIDHVLKPIHHVLKTTIARGGTPYNLRANDLSPIGKGHLLLSSSATHPNLMSIN